MDAAMVKPRSTYPSIILQMQHASLKAERAIRDARRQIARVEILLGRLAAGATAGRRQAAPKP